jgi:arginine deiminase
MLNHFCQLSDKIYITSIPKTSKAKKREKQIEKMIYRFRPGLTGTAFSFGAIQSRISLIDPGDFWRTELFGAAIHVNNIINTSGVKLEEPGRKTG